MEEIPSVTLRGCLVSVHLLRADGSRAEGVVHIEENGLVGVSSPVGVPAVQVAARTIPLLRQVIATLEVRVADPLSWVTPPASPA